MWKRIAVYGIAAGAIVGAQFTAVMALSQGREVGAWGVAIGYATMLLALSLVFVAVKRQRDLALGGVIRFLPALAMGLAISTVAGIIYATTWEAILAVTGMDFAGDYARQIIEQQKAKGLTGPELEKLIRDMETFKAQYAQPLYRFGATFLEIAPVGVLVSLVSAGLLRNPRFMPARRS